MEHFYRYILDNVGITVIPMIELCGVKTNCILGTQLGITQIVYLM